MLLVNRVIVMYLKEINTSGFKSFADKLSITLDDKITCIVGPNGSGKSNIVDAVRWVLGEQSVKSLRGDGAMTDVIFSGSKTRNPLNVASVSLVFDNSDNYLKVPYTEVAIKRRVYRTGENEYFLNGEKCRLKDITDLFLDSGIGKESFNIISQGEVQKILSNSPYDRRVIFEEASGVLKYKKRKEEALRKLDKTHNNLDRVNDIVSELEVQIAPLKEQSIKAKEYLENKAGVEKYEVALLAYDIEEMMEEYRQTKDKCASLEQEVLFLSNQFTSSDVRVSSLKNDLLRIEKELDEKNQALLLITKEVEKINGEKNILKERSKYDSSSDLIHQNILSLKEEQGKRNVNISLLEEEVHQINSELILLREKENERTSLIQTYKNKKATLEKEFIYQNKKWIGEMHKVELLKQEMESGGNIPNSVKAILGQTSLRGIHNCIGNLVEVEDVYAKALEIAIASSKYFVVTEDEESAKRAISYLKDEKLGRATFFPMNVIKPKGVDPTTLNQLKQEADFVGILVDLISFDPKYYNIFSNQFGNVIVAKDMESANQLSRKINHRYKIITLEGDVIHIGGSMTGGSYYERRSIISIKQEYKRSQKQVVAIKATLDQLEQEISELDQKIQKVEEVQYQNKTEEIRKIEIQKNKEEQLEQDRQQLEDTLKELRSLEHVVDSSLAKEEERVIALYYEKVSEKDKLTVGIKALEKEEDRIKTTIEEIEAEDKLQNALLRKKETELKECEIKKSKMDVKLDTMLATLNEEYALTFEKAKENYVLDIEVEDARSKLAIYKNNMKKLGMVNLASIEEYDRVNTRYEFLDKQRNDLVKAQDTLLEIMDEMDDVMREEFEKTFHSIEIEFKQVFKELFNGGNATLKLTDPDNLLETGVEIIASPPGKKLTTISLLSGGEKTLTAISLLFAILNVRTVPFCLFDEVEAALDDANVKQFGKYLDHYKTKTQFLIITHKKKTMEYADTLYGITMQESGVSKLVSVKLNRSEEYL